MDFEWMEDIPALKRAKDAFNFRQRTGDFFSWLPKAGLVPKPPARRPGISALMRLKNESRWIEAAIRSLAPFVDHFSIVDNGSTDGTPEIITRVAQELGLDYTLDLMPGADFGDVCDRALDNTKCRWVLRWDGDMIARTSGDMTLARLREYVLSLDQDRYYAVYFPHIRLEGDLFHQDPDYRIHYEEWLFTWSPKLYHRRTGRFREVMYPFYYKRLYVWDIYSFHLASLDEPAAMIRRKYWVEWRKRTDRDRYPVLDDYVREKIAAEYDTESFEDAGALYLRERCAHLVPFDPAKYGDYPDLLKPFLDTIPLKLVYRNGRIAGRTDIMDTLDRLDAERRNTTVDVVMSTRGRPEMAVETVRHLLEQDYPHFRVVVVDQNDEPIAVLDSLAESHANLVHHIARTRGLPAGRNEGVRMSQADIVIFVDDDIIPDAGFIEAHVQAFRDSSVGGTAGSVREIRPEMNAPVPKRKIGRLNYWRGEIYRGFTYDRPRDIESAQGVNMAFRRRVILDAGGFDTGFGGTFFFEETDLCLRVRKLGFTIRYTPAASLTHLGAPTGGCRIEDEVRLAYWYGHNFMLLFLKHFPRKAFPVWFTVRIGKFIRDIFRTKSLKPFLSGVHGMFDAFRTYGAAH